METTEMEKLRRNQRMTTQMEILHLQIVQSLTVQTQSPIKRTVKQKVPQMTVQPRRNQTVTAQMEMIRDRSRRSQTEITETIRPQAATRVVLRTVIIPRVRPSNSPIFRKVTS